MAYKPQSVQLKYLPKPGSTKQRPLGIPFFEDKLSKRDWCGYSNLDFPLKVLFNLPESLLTYLLRARVVENPKYLFYLYDRILFIDTVSKKSLERSWISFHCCREISYSKISDKITFLFEIPVFF